MEKNLIEDLMGLVPTEVVDNYKLTKNQTVVLGQLIMLNNLDETVNNGGWSYRSNTDLADDCEITTTGLRSIINKLLNCNLIQRKTGNRKDGASLYKVNTEMIFNNNFNKTNSNMENIILNNQISNRVSNFPKEFPNEFPNQVMTYLIESLNVIEKLIEERVSNRVSNFPNNLPTDTESDIDTEIEKEYINKLNTINNKLNINNNINKNTNSNKEKDNIINNITEKEEIETEVEENLKEEKTEVEETKTVQDDNIEFASAPTVDINETVEDDEDDTRSLSDEELEARLTKYFNEHKDSITNETEYNDFETVFNMVLQNYVDNEQITREQFNHARLFTVLPLLSSLRGILLKKTKTEEKALSEPSKEETLTTIQEDKENGSEPTEMASDEEIYDAFGNDVKKEMEFAFKEAEETQTRDNNLKALETECGAVFVNPMEVKIEVDTKKDEREELRKKCLARMKSLFSSASTKDEVNAAHKAIVEGLETLHQEGKLDNISFNSLKQKAWFMYTDTVNALSKKAA